uniref:CSON008883 protein n=1 Tax=Culicoides sonorensis TaxID=179676 RepID=A0A336KDW4_CULSO
MKHNNCQKLQHINKNYNTYTRFMIIIIIIIIKRSTLTKKKFGILKPVCLLNLQKHIKKY